MPSRKIEKRKAVSLKEKSTAGDGVTVSLDGLKSIQSKARGPGEVAGPAIRVTVRVRNGTPDRLDLSGAEVNLTDADGNPGSSMTGPPADPLPADLNAGSSATAVYVFDVSRQQRNPVTIEVDVAASMPTVVFKGKA